MTTYGSISNHREGLMMDRRRSINSQKLITPFKKLYNITPLPPGFSKFPACKIILLIVLLHRVHIYSSFNFIVGLTATRNLSKHHDLVDEDSTVTAQLLMSCARLLAPVTGILADKYLPRVQMLQLCLFISCIGSSIQSLFHSLYELNFPFLDIPPAVYYCVHAIAISLLTVGSSGAYALLVPVGVDQMEGANEVRLKSYFSWHYWCINVGAVLAAGRYFTYVSNPNDRHILLASSYLATLSVFFALLLLMLSLHCSLLQRNQPPGGTPLRQVAGVIWCALSNRYAQRRESAYSPLRLSDYALLENRGRYSYEEVQDVKTFFKILLVLLCMTWYFGVDNLYNTIFPLQGAEISGGKNNFKSTLVIFLSACVTILIALPLVEFIRNVVRKTVFSFTKILYKFFIGVIISYVGLLIALALNIYSYKTPHFSVPIFIIIPQTMLIALSECFAVVGAMEFVYAQSPYQMIGFLFGILQCIIGIGSYIPNAIYYILQRASSCYAKDNCRTCLVPWPSCFEKQTLDFVYYSVYAVLTLVYLVGIFIMVKMYKRRERQKIEVWPRSPMTY